LPAKWRPRARKPDDKDKRAKTALMMLETRALIYAGRLVPAHPREWTAAAMLLLTASCVPGQVDAPRIASVAAPAVAPLPPEEALVPQALVAVAPGTAAAINASIPLSTAPNPAARAFDATDKAAADQLRSLDCLTAAVYYEAASESEGGQRAVAQVVLNRARHPAYPGTVCGVVYQGPMKPGGGCQFTFTCDGSLRRAPSASGWARARRIAADALAGKVYAPVGHSTHYHTRQVLPVWASRLVKSAEIGAHIFYRFGGGAGAPAAFARTYRGGEPNPAALAARSLASAPVIRASAALPAARRVSNPELLVSAPDDNLPVVVLTTEGLPESTIREEYRHSGMPRPEIAAAAAAPVR
jgi:spore germination cell wall hydrolase CwlJ-like protein